MQITSLSSLVIISYFYHRQTLPHFLSTNTKLQYMQGEIELMRRLNHPHIVEYYETIRTEGYLNIVLECVNHIPVTSFLVFLYFNYG